MAEYEIYIVLGIVIGVTLLVTFATFRDMNAFFSFLLILLGFGVYSGVLDTWIFIFGLMITTAFYLRKVKLGLVISTIAMLLIISIFSITTGNEFIGQEVSNLVDTEVLINGTTSTYNYSGTSFININPLTGFIVALIGVLVVAGIIGVQLFGSGLNESSSRAIIFSLFYIGIWTILSFLAYPLIISIELYGILLYLLLTILYAIGVMKEYFGGIS